MSLLQLQSYDFIKDRRNKVYIYKHKSGDHFLKIGGEAEIYHEIDLYKKLCAYGIKVPQVLEEGKIGDKFYFKESSVGDLSFHDIFKNSFLGKGYIEDIYISQYIDIVRNYTRAQISTTNIFSDSSTYTNVFGCMESDAYISKDILDQVKNKIGKYLSNTKIVYNHGDFNPHNIFYKGIIDWEDAYNDYFGLDHVSFLHHYWFPCIIGPIPHRSYCYSIDQIKHILSELSDQYVDLINPYIFGSLFMIRAMRACANMKLVDEKYLYRYKTLEILINLFLKEENILNIILSTINTDLRETLRKGIYTK